MLKLSPPGFGRLVQAHQFDVGYSGAEANVAVSLSNFGVSTVFLSVVPDNEMGTAAMNAVRKYGVDTSSIVRMGERLGIYFTEKGASQRPSKVLYDRKGSAISSIDDGCFDWDSVFSDAKWFHFTGITPALSDSLANTCLEACKIAKSKGVTVSCDLNFRSKLWSNEQANKVMKGIFQYVDVCIANETDIKDVFGIGPCLDDVEHGVIDEKSYSRTAKTLMDMFGLRVVCVTLRQSISASDNNWSAILYDGKSVYSSRKYSIHLVDRIGGGDSFSAGLIYGLLNGYDMQYVLDFAVAASCLKQTIEGDFNLVTVGEVNDLMATIGTGRIQR